MKNPYYSRVRTVTNQGQMWATPELFWPLTTLTCTYMYRLKCKTVSIYISLSLSTLTPLPQTPNSTQNWDPQCALEYGLFCWLCTDPQSWPHVLRTLSLILGRNMIFCLLLPGNDLYVLLFSHYPPSPHLKKSKECPKTFGQGWMLEKSSLPCSSNH